MSKLVFCGNCGKRLTITRKALPKIGRIIDIVEYHECYDEPVELDLEPLDVPIPAKHIEGKEKFVQKLNDLSSPPSNDYNLKDRRPQDQVKSTAPPSLINQLKFSPHQTPTKLLTDF
jgi:hypothetical protein